MRASRWLLHAGPPALILATLGIGWLVGPIGAVRHASAAVGKSCPPQNGLYAAVHKAPRKAPLATTVNLKMKLSAAGELVGRTLQIAGGASRQVDLAAESFAAKPVANVIVFGDSAAGRGSTVRALDLETGCDFILFSGTTDAVRSAVIDAELGSLYVHSVAAGDRSDRGVRQIDLATGGTQVAVQPIAADDGFGITYATRLAWSLDGDELAVQSCGIAACRTQVHTPSTGATQLLDDPHGELVGLTHDRLVAFDTCPELPCALESVDRASGSIAALGVDAFSAELDAVDGAVVVIAQTPAGTKEIRP